MKVTRILVSRPDRLGDVILSTPVMELLKQQFPRSELYVLVQPSVAPVIRGLSIVDSVIEYEPNGRHAGFRGILKLSKELRAIGFRIAVALQSSPRVALAMFLAGIRYRVGPYSKPHSYLLYNRGARQRRSEVEMHEADYNLHLLRRLGARVTSRKIPTRVHVSDEAKNWAELWLRSKSSDGSLQAPVVVHPGMGGSALNWPEIHYIELVRALLREGRKVLVTGGPAEGDLLERIRRALSSDGSADRVWVYGGAEAGPVDRLGALFSFASVVVAPSTGPLHLAVALGKRVVSFYPPIRVQSAVRWGPYVQDDSRASVLVPENYCGEDFSCRGSLCNHYPCMKSLTVREVLEKVRQQLGAEST